MVADRQLHRLKQPASLRRQAGIGWMGWTTILLMAGVIGLMALRLVPHYIDYITVLDVARTLQRESDIGKKSKAELKAIVAGRFRQNNLYKMKTDVLKFSKTPQQRLVVLIDYERREPLFGNIELVVKFNKKLHQLN